MTEIAVVGHTSRLAMIETLAAAVEPAFITIDDGTLGCTKNHRCAWEALQRNDRGWVVVLEDDAVPAAGFRDQLDQALAVAPSPVVSLYLGRSRPRRPQAAIAELVRNGCDACWIVADEGFHAVGIALRGDCIGAMLHAAPMFLPIDKATGMAARRLRVSVAYTWPSLIDHADTEPAITAHPDGQPREPGRAAWRAGGRDTWDARCLRFPAVDSMH
jgi:hypothetical protein